MNIIVFDTETAGCKTQTLLNVGYKILDLNIQKGEAHTLVARDYLITEVINNELFMLNDMFVGEEKYKKYKYLLENKLIIKRSIKQIFATMARDITKHKVLFGFAYNCDFDTDKFAKTAQLKALANPLEILPIFDIWAYAVNHICKTSDYIEWAKANEIFTETQFYISTSVESVCKYMYNNLDFVENHTALSDVDHEVNILIECVRRGCDITRAEKMKGRYIPSEKVFKKTIIINGEKVEFEYTKRKGKADADVVRYE